MLDDVKEETKQLDNPMLLSESSLFTKSISFTSLLTSVQVEANNLPVVARA